jgi:2-dehydropantoate 2-reductase
MDETVAAANADLASHGLSESAYLGDEDKRAMMQLSDDMGAYKTSTMLDLTQRKPMEVHYLFRRPVQRAEKLGIPVPHLETLVIQIEAMQRMYNLF